MKDKAGENGWKIFLKIESVDAILLSTDVIL